MLRLAHRIVTTNIQDVNVIGAVRYSDQQLMQIFSDFSSFKSRVSDAVCIVADNVSEYYMSGKKDEYDLSEDFPFCIPFASTMFVEWKDAVDSARQCGVLVETQDMGEFRDDDIPRFVITMQMAIFVRGEFIFSEPSLIIHLNFDGSCAVSPKIKAFADHNKDPHLQQTVKAMTSNAMHIPLLTMSFANCKNVSQEIAGKECEPDPPWTRKNNPPQIRYRVLNISPMKEVLKTEGGSDANGIQKALHICRGHFRRCEHPFGRDKPQTMWISSHTRGKAERGIVLKDYSIGKPK